jgi:hypothetical protein
MQNGQGGGYSPRTVTAGGKKSPADSMRNRQAGCANSENSPGQPYRADQNAGALPPAMARVKALRFQGGAVSPTFPRCAQCRPGDTPPRPLP